MTTWTPNPTAASGESHGPWIPEEFGAPKLLISEEQRAWFEVER